MTDSDVKTETWKPVPGAGYYEVSDHACVPYGAVRSVDRPGRDGQPIKAKKTGTSRYWQAKIRRDDGSEWTTTIHSLVLLAHVGPCPPGMEACHADDNPDNNHLSNLRWDYPAANIADRMRNNPAVPKPPKLCIVCDEPFDTSGRRCAGCREKIARNAAVMLAHGTGLQETADAVDYPPVPLLKLAQQLGGLRLSVTPAVIADEVNAALGAAAFRPPWLPIRGHAESPKRRLRSVLFGRKASRRNSDGA